jgi:hypothetical protein
MASETSQKERSRKIFRKPHYTERRYWKGKEESKEEVSFFVLRKFSHDRSLGRPFFARNLFRSFCLGLQFS